MDDQAVSDAIQNFGQWPLLGIILIAMLRFWRRSDDSFVGIIAELRKSLEREQDARIRDKEEYDEKIKDLEDKHDRETTVLKNRITQLETLLNSAFGGGGSA